MIFNDDAFNELFEIIKKVFRLIDDENFSDLRSYEIDELLNRQVSEMEFYKQQGKKLHYDKVICYPLNGSDVMFDERSGVYTTSLKVSYEKYVTDENGEVIDGLKDYIVESKYLVSFMDNKIDSSTKEICNYCGAKIPLNINRCEYCGSIKDRKTSKWIICDISEIVMEDLESKIRKEKHQNNSKEWDNLLKELDKTKHKW